MINQLGEQQVSQMLSNFMCPNNRDVESFLKHRAIEFAKQKISQTQLIFMQYKGQPRLVGYYSLTNKIISIKDDNLTKTLKKRIAKYGVRDASNKGFMISAHSPARQKLQ